MVLVSTATRGEGLDSPGEIPAVRLLAGGLPARVGVQDGACGDELGGELHVGDEDVVRWDW